MKIDHVDEPELEFSTGRHVDIRFGVAMYGPIDAGTPRAPSTIRVGIVGVPRTNEGLRRWLERCRDPIDGKKSPKPNLFPRFPGFNHDTGFRSSLALDTALDREILERDLDEIVSGSPTVAIREAVALFVREIEHLVSKSRPDVIICALPMSLVPLMGRDRAGAQFTRQDRTISAAETQYVDFHDLLKAECMRLGVTIQVVLPMTYDPSQRLPKSGRPEQVRQLQDEATRAWNFHTALYYKAGGTPWRMPRSSVDLATCYVGIAFYRSLDGSQLFTSCAQVFNERGDGIILRGGSATRSTEDRQVHLKSADAHALLSEALARYRTEHKTSPARVVVHKTSGFDAAEMSGFSDALSRERITTRDFLHVRGSGTRLCRTGQYPPLRGTLLSLSDMTHVLYSRGSVDFYATYPGMYVPRPLEIRLAACDETPLFLSREILALTKMNWNNTQFDGREPITLKAARQVGNVLRYVPADQTIESRYSYYM